ncbi:MAG TPA: hypothetical protein VG736_11390 [Vicinamibacterales bacterium]|jgi:hypothetical protein|nr:hypothetical protein [Vicinamibacterales bacterium]
MRPWPRLNVHRQRRVRLLRRTGACLFAASIAVATIVYRIGIAHREPSVEELLPGTAAAIARQRGIMYGRTGAALFDLFEGLQEPAGHAFLLIVAGFIAAAICYQAAHRIEVEEG